MSVAPARRQGLIGALAARLHRRRDQPPAPPPRVLDGAEVDLRRATIQRGGTLHELSSLELKLLRYLLDRPSIVVTRDELLDRVWGYEVPPRSRTVDVHVANLRRKLERDPSRPELIRTVYGLGYKFVGSA